MARLVLKLDDVVLREIAIENIPVTIGRLPDNTIPLDNLAVSGRHARIVRERGQYLLYDEGSTNGTYINGQKVSRSTLANGDTIHVGRHSITFLDEPIEAKKPPAIGMLHVLSGKTDRADYILDRDVTVIGRGELANVRLKRLFAPKVAATIYRREGKYFVQPGPGTISVNSEIMRGERELTAGDTIAVDAVTLAFNLKS